MITFEKKCVVVEKTPVYDKNCAFVSICYRVAVSSLFF